jgi:hypothetical protein
MDHRCYRFTLTQPPTCIECGQPYRSACQVSRRICERGTQGCDIDHTNADAGTTPKFRISFAEVKPEETT